MRRLKMITFVFAEYKEHAREPESKKRRIMTCCGRRGDEMELCSTEENYGKKSLLL